MSLLMIFEILGLFINILTADKKSSVRNNKNLQQVNQLQESKKKKLCLFFFFICQICIKFWIFWEKRWPS